MKAMKPEWDNMETFLSENLQEFRPFAYFDKHLDCVRVKFEDCSVTDVRKNTYITVLKPNRASNGTTGHNAGFTIKGIAHICDAAHIPLKAGLSLVALLDAVLKAFPDAASKGLMEEFLSKAKGMEINFDDSHQAA